MFRIPRILRQGIIDAVACTSSGTCEAASPMTTSAKHTASTVRSSRSNAA